MATEFLVGNDGGANFGSLGYAHLSSWSATFSRNSSVITGFGDSAVRRRLGYLDVTGAAGGHMIYNDSDHTPTGHFIAGTNGSSASSIMDGQSVVLYVGDPAGTQANPIGSPANGKCGFSITCVFSSIAVNVDKNGDSTVTFNWEASGGGSTGSETISEVWDESAS